VDDDDVVVKENAEMSRATLYDSFVLGLTRDGFSILTDESFAIARITSVPGTDRLQLITAVRASAVIEERGERIDGSAEAPLTINRAGGGERTRGGENNRAFMSG